MVLVRAALCAAGAALVGTLALLYYGVTGPGATTDRFRSLPFLDMWLRWDAGWYRAIAEEGYYFTTDYQSSVAYFPLYPLVIRALHALGLNTFVAGVLTTLAAGLVTAVLFRAWAAKRMGEERADEASWLLLLWPFAFFLYGAMYSDALFLALIVGAFFSLERRQLAFAVTLGALATAARPVAPAVVLGLFLRNWELRRQEQAPLGVRDAVPLLSSVGLLAYMSFLWWNVGDPLAFVTAQSAWKQLPGPATWLKLGLFERAQSPEDWVLPLLHAALTFLFLALAIPMRRALGYGYSAYVLVVLGVPLISSRDFIGLGRYALAAFPCFLMLASVLHERPRLLRGWMALSAVLLVIMTVRLAVGRYVS